MPSRLTKNSALKVAVIFLIVGLLWIFLSDSMVTLLSDNLSSVRYFQNIKGAFFVIATALLIYWLVSRELKQKNQLISFLNKSEHWYNLMVSNIPNVDIYLFDPDGRLILSQGSVLASQGLDVYRLRGKYLSSSDLSQKTKDFVIPMLDKILKGVEQEDVYGYKEKYLQLNGVPLLDDKQNVFAGLLVITDVTQQYKLISRLRESSEEFERLYKEYYKQNTRLTEKNISLHELNERYIKAQRKAEESDRLKTSFLSNMSHEIRTPLNAIIGFSQIMGNDTLSQNEIEEYSRIIAHSGENLLTIIDDILVMSQLEAGQYEIKQQQYVLREVWNEIQFNATEFLSRNGDGRKLLLKVDESLFDHHILIDVDVLLSMMKRLLDNAVKFSDPLTPVKLEMHSDDNGFILFSVIDQGAGIPEDKFDEIFTRFTQLKTNNLQPVAGNGLGLSIVKSLSKAIGAEVKVYSTLDYGSRFSVCLPVRHLQKNQKTHTMSELGNRQKAQKLLVVEDVKDNFVLIKAYLRNYNIELFHQPNAMGALKFLEENPDVDLIMMDIRLPDGNGVSLTKKLRKNGIVCPIIAQTAYADSQDKHMCLEAGCTDYLSKPIHKAQFLETIRNYVELEEINS